MSSTQTFDYDNYRRGFRAACVQRGIDPLKGANAYQVAHFRAEQRSRDRQRTIDRWWQQHDLWTACPPYHSDTEEDAIWELFHQTYLLTLHRILRAKRRQREWMPLRELHQHQQQQRSRN